MLNLNRAKLKSTLAAIIGLLAVLGPKLLEIFGTPTNHWAALGVQAFGAIVLACTTGRAVLLLNKFLPDATRATDTQSGYARTSALVGLVGVSALAGLVLAPACHNVPADKFLNAVVDCAKVNPQASAALAQVETCLVSAVSGNPAACLSGLITDAHFTVDEVACVVAYVAQQQQSAVASGRYTDATLAERQAAVDWLTRENISIRNSYQPGR